MVKKLKFKKFQINFSNKLFYTLVAIGIFIAIGIGVYAYGGSQPSVFGHSAGELNLSEGVNGNAIFNGNVGIGTTSPGTNKLEVVGGPIKATGGLIIETRTSDPASPVTGQIWLRTDL